MNYVINICVEVITLIGIQGLIYKCNYSTLIGMQEGLI